MGLQKNRQWLDLKIIVRLIIINGWMKNNTSPLKNPLSHKLLIVIDKKCRMKIIIFYFCLKLAPLGAKYL